MSATLGSALATAARALEGRGIESPRREARLLVSLAAECDSALVLAYPERPLPQAAAERLHRYLARRMAGEPISRIAGAREFWSLEFALSPETLDPRPDSETLVAAALEALAGRTGRLRILDLGTGSGCLLLALLKELPDAIGVGVDLAPGAVAQARRNAVSNHMEDRAFFVTSRWGDALRGGFDLALANPPYLAARELAGLAPEIRLHDPALALDGGADGLQCYRELGGDLPRLAPLAIVEVGAGQADAVAQIFAGAGLDAVARHRDLQGIERCLVLARRKKMLEVRTLPV